MSSATKLCKKTNTIVVPTAKASVAQSEMRHAALRIGRLPVLEDIANSSHGSYQRRLSRAVNFTAQSVNMHVNHVRVGLDSHAPDFIENHRSCYHPACV